MHRLRLLKWNASGCKIDADADADADAPILLDFGQMVMVCGWYVYALVHIMEWMHPYTYKNVMQ